MKYSFTTAALVGAIFVATGIANPISTGSLSSASSTPSFSPHYTGAAGNFTAIAGSSPTITPVPSSSLDSSDFPTNFGLGPVILQTSSPEPSNTLTTSIVGTSTKTSVTGSSTEDLFPNFTPKLGHGPVVPGRGFNQTQKPPNSTGQTHKLAPTSLIINDAVLHPSYPEGHCKYYSMRWICESWVRIDRWWNAGPVSYHQHTSREARHKLKLHQPRSVHMDFNSTNSSLTTVPARNSTLAPVKLQHSIEAAASPTPRVSKTPTPAKKSSTTKANHMTHVDHVRAGRKLNHKIREKEKIVAFYRTSIVETKQQIKKLNAVRDSTDEQIFELQARRSYEIEQVKKIKIELQKLRRERRRLEYSGRRY